MKKMSVMGSMTLFDLGEFNQKGTVRTKYGFQRRLSSSHSSPKSSWEFNLWPMWFFNHKAAADHSLEAFQVIEVDPVDRTVELGEPFIINGWTSFTFDGQPRYLQ